MKIAILSRAKNCYSTQRLVKAAKALGHFVEVIDPLQCYMNIASRKPEIHYQNRNLEIYDAIIPRIGASITFYGCSVLRQFEMMGTFSVNSSVAITRSRNKLRALQLLSRKGVGMPVTGFAHSSCNVQDLIRMVGGPPLIIKLLEGTQGIGVVLAETKKVAESVIEALFSVKQNFMVQEYIKEANGQDIRCFVVGDQVVAAMQRQAKAGEFRSNLHRGGSAGTVEITEDERETALLAAKIMGLHVAGVDLLRSSRGPLVLEVNSSPGLEGIENATGKNVAEAVIRYIETHAKPIDPQSKYEA